MTHSTATTLEDSEQAPLDAARTVVMIRPAAFRRNDVTRPTNSFQSTAAKPDTTEVSEKARAEFDRCAEALQDLGIKVQIFAGRQSIELPDEVFANNWMSLHPDGSVVLYPMMAWNRREERRRDILDQLQQQAGGFRVDRIVDLTHLEHNGWFLEGTGSLVMDHANRLAYTSFSPRTHVDALREFGREMNYDIIGFSALGERGRAVYHTNVMMSLGEKFAVVCLESIPQPDERLRVLMRLERSGREVIELRHDQLRHFCGNILQLNGEDQRVIVMSKRARQAFDKRQLAALSQHGALVAVDVDTIETFGGGSVRCMLTEVLLPHKTAQED